MAPSNCVYATGLCRRVTHDRGDVCLLGLARDQWSADPSGLSRDLRRSRACTSSRPSRGSCPGDGAAARAERAIAVLQPGQRAASRPSRDDLVSRCFPPVLRKDRGIKRGANTSEAGNFGLQVMQLAEAVTRVRAVGLKRPIRRKGDFPAPGIDQEGLGTKDRVSGQAEPAPCTSCESRT